MPDRFLETDSADTFKGFVHYVVGSGALAMALYNIGAYLTRKEPRLLLNTAIYGAIWLYEARETLRHQS